MERLGKCFLIFIIWYGVGIFVSSEFNPTRWWIIGKMLIVVLYAMSLLLMYMWDEVNKEKPYK